MAADAGGRRWTVAAQPANSRLWFDVSDRIMCLGRIALLRKGFAQAQARALHERARRLAVEQHHKVGEYHYEVGRLALIECREGRLGPAEECCDARTAWSRHFGAWPPRLSARHEGDCVGGLADRGADLGRDPFPAGLPVEDRGH
ncbi:hypothetical protein [Nonomuraea sp. NPDC049400]|uniref:hypothetical protein n=1 Tax=Nonomuraea sp. NPDC049400 TaxID=3364352 RepID=UPI0037A8AEE4